MNTTDENVDWIAVSLFDVPPEDVPPRPSWGPGTLLVRNEPKREPATLLFENVRR